MHSEPPISIGSTTEDRELLRRYTQEGSAAAFAEMVQQHLNHVYSTALRRVNGDHALAEDVTQTVFVDFARKAGGIAADAQIGGWLHRHTGFVASKMIDRERRRRAREQEAVTMNDIMAIESPHATDPIWTEAAPLLDEAIDALPASDRDALVLRFFEQKDFRSVGQALGMSDDSAQKKVSRALEKLRQMLARKGVVSPVGALASLLAIYAVTPAPGALAGLASAQSLAGAAVGARSLGEIISGLTAATRIKVAAVAVAALVAAVVAGKKWGRAVKDPPVYLTSQSSSGPASEPPKAALQMPSSPTPDKLLPPADGSASSLVTSAAAAWTTNQGVSGTALALGFLNQLKANQLPEALAVALQVQGESVRSLLLRNLVGLWAESDQQAALSWAADHPETNRIDMDQAILNDWAGNDPNAVIKVTGKTGAAQVRPVSERVTAALFRTLALKNPEAAFARLDEISNPNDRGQAIRGILDTIQSDTDRDRIFTLVSNIKDDEIRVQARRASVEQWAARDAPAAAAYVEKAEPAWERTRLMDSLGLAWLQSDPTSAAAWWVAQAPGPDTLVKIINVWAQQAPNDAGRWLAQQPAGPASDTARMTFARQVEDLDPESALRWAETVSDTTMREGTIDHVYKNWRLRDATAAGAFLDNSQWPADRLGRLKKSP